MAEIVMKTVPIDRESLVHKAIYVIFISTHALLTSRDQCDCNENHRNVAVHTFIV